MLKYKETHPNVEIKFKVFRNTGSVYYQYGSQNSVFDFVFSRFNKKLFTSDENWGSLTKE